jgi:uncharacterized protein YehS (DUF1456 family)
MKNNIIFRQLRYIFDWNEVQMMAIFAQAEMEVAKATITAWLHREEHEEYQEILDIELAAFLNGVINQKRGKREGPQPAPEKRLNNNIIFRKLKIALNYRDTDILETFQLVGFTISKHEISAIFRNPKQNQYKVCQDQFLRNFLHGLQLKYRPKKEVTEEKKDSYE